MQKGVEGATGVIRCEASGDPQPKMQWYHNGRQIPGITWRKWRNKREEECLRKSF